MRTYSKKTAESRKHFRKLVLDRDQQCRAIIDGKRCNKRAVDPHHIVHRVSRIDDVPEDGIGLCREHHTMVDTGKLKVRSSWLTQDQIKWIKKRKWKGWNQIIWDLI